MTGDNVPEFTTGLSKWADTAAVTRVLARGEKYSFTGTFLVNFIERER